MAKDKKPKFKIGDTVVINIYGTVGKITDLKLMDGAYVYEVNHSEGLYLESSLEHITSYQGEIVTESEQIDIVYKYFFGDLVQVEGYGTDLFKVIGFRTEIWRYKENAWEDVIYELSKVTDGEWLEAHEDELNLIADYETADTYIQKFGFLYPISNKMKKVELTKKAVPKKTEKEWLDWKKEKVLLIDGLLDLYNDYRSLYDAFQDEEYKLVMQLVLKKIQAVADELYKKA
ncbi:hypothetical protein [Peribacillus kribbensis]|uniref:hypothetical protein n=1 Tax=Peribacillus kribbensis TaxID=356658 RepID=UPI00041BF26B|nr:hypothetical protein [Peribacillus kribbensis]